LTWPGKCVKDLRMTTLEKIEAAIADLNANEIEVLAAWFAKFRSDLWDRQIAHDAQAGLLDKLADAALSHHRAGRTTPF
jgi:hypothetical protein